MDIAATKIELASKLLNTKDKELINYLKAIFSTQPKDWWEELPPAIQDSVIRGLKQAEKGETIAHDKVMKKYAKWLKK
jgi:predicted transcriptional regulator